MAGKWQHQLSTAAIPLLDLTARPLAPPPPLRCSAYRDLITIASRSEDDAENNGTAVSLQTAAANSVNPFLRLTKSSDTCNIVGLNRVAPAPNQLSDCPAGLDIDTNRQNDGPVFVQKVCVGFG